jgi:hypothetical protein
MSRSFDPTAGADSITFAVGNAPPDQGPITVAVLAKATSTAGWTGWIARGLDGGSAVWGFLTSSNSGAKLFAENDFGNGVSGLSTSWRWYVMTKASGSAAPRIHVWDLSGTWTHTDNSAAVGDGSGPIDSFVIGGAGGTSNGWRGSIAVAALWASALDDAGVEAAMTLAAADTLDAAPDWMARFNQAAITTDVTDDTAGGGDQSAIAGTTVDADDPSGYDYSLTTTTVTPDGIAVPVAVGAPTVSQSFTVVPDGIAVSTALGAPTVSQSFTLVPDGIAVPVALGAPRMLAGHAFPDGIAVPVALGEPTVSGAVYVPPEGGSWESLLGVVHEARADAARDAERLANPLDCPVHGWPLRRVHGRLWCLFGGHVL